jgi:phosphatidylserine/phosphatidylglycerophosphate/cardiolipin synthase-like enzyme
MKRLRLLTAILIVCVWAGPAGAFDASNTLPGSGTIEYAFSPGDDAAGLAMRAIDAARSQVLVQAFSFTHEQIAAALIRAHRRGVEVQVIADPGQIALIDHNVVGMLAAGGIPVFTDGAHLSAHNKVIVIDARSDHPVLVTGSFNFTFAAQFRNAENLLVFRGNRELAGAFQDNWERHRSHSAPYGAGSNR